MRSNRALAALLSDFKGRITDEKVGRRMVLYDLFTSLGTHAGRRMRSCAISIVGNDGAAIGFGTVRDHSERVFCAH